MRHYVVVLAAASRCLERPNATLRMAYAPCHNPDSSQKDKTRLAL